MPGQRGHLRDTHVDWWKIGEGITLIVFGVVLILEFFGIDVFAIGGGAGMGLQNLVNDVASATTISINAGALSIQFVLSHLLFGCVLCAIGLKKYFE